MEAGTRIGRLSIAAQGRRGVAMVAAMVEEAFRTQDPATGPAARAGLLVIRRIDLGPVTGRADQGALNRRVARALKGGGGLRPLPLPPGPATPPDAAIAAAPAVLFPDPQAPARRVLAAIGAGHPVPRSWPYRAALGPGLSAPAPVLAARLVAAIAARPEAAPALAEALVLLGSRAPEALAGQAPGTLPRLAALLTAAAPERALPPSAPAPDAPAMPPLPAATADALRRLLAQDAQAEPGARPVAEVLAAAAIARATNRPAPPARIAALLDRLAPRPAPATATAPSAAARPEAPAATRPEAPAAAPQGAHFPPAAMDPRPAAQPPGPLGAAAPAPPRPAAAPPPRPAAEDAARVAAEEATAPDAPIDAPAPPTWPKLPASRHAGLVLLIALVDRAFGDWLATPGHLAAGTGQRLLARLAAPLRLPPGDPWLPLLGGGAPEGDPPAPTFDPRFAPAFALPAEMAAEVAAVLRGPVEIAPLAGRPGWRVATLARGQVALGAWQGRAPAALRRALAGRALRRAPARDLPPSTPERSAALAVRLWLRRRARLPLAALIRRPGWVQMTATHLDVVFDAGLVSLPVRRHGLDLSPGWCAWLWRVVTIHYDFGGSEGGVRDA